MHIQLCIIRIEMEPNTRMILYNFTQRSSISEKWIGPRTESWGTPYNKFLASDKIDPILIH